MTRLYGYVYDFRVGYVIAVDHKLELDIHKYVKELFI